MLKIQTKLFLYDRGYDFGLDIMGGIRSKYDDAINIDKMASDGIAALIEDVGRFFSLDSFSWMVCDNPTTDFLEFVTPLLHSDGTLIVRGNYKNRYFKKIWDFDQTKISAITNFDVVERKLDVPNLGYRKENGESVVGTIKEIKLVKKSDLGYCKSNKNRMERKWK